jgi:hypothetical protein
MEKMQKLQLMDKILRELDDLKSSQTSVLKKVTQIETENISLSLPVLDKELSDIHENIDKGIEHVANLSDEFKAYRDKFSADNKLEEQPAANTGA